METRRAIARKAYEAYLQGAHYLTGCYGAYPESCDPVIGRQLYLIEDPKYDSLGIHAAEIRMPKVYRCAGRYGKVGGRRLDDSAGRRLLRDYESANSGCLPDEFPSIDGLYPRYAQHSTTYEKWYLLGESCRNKMHFDCVGLVNWAVSRVAGLSLQFGVRMWGDSAVGPVAVEDPPFSELLPGDILVRLNTKPEHIAIVGIGGQLIEASGFDKGVIESYETGGYHKHSRITDEWLRRPVVYGRSRQ